jgi:hypothetical protein
VDADDDVFEGDDWELGDGQALYQIVADCFEALTPDEAVALVGLLFSCRIELAKEKESLGPKAEQIDLNELEPLEPDAAADLVGGLFHYDRRMLLERFEKEWGGLASSTVAMRIKRRLEGHPQVEKIESNEPI